MLSLKHYLEQGWTAKEIAEHYGMKPSKIARLIRKYKLDTINSILNAEGNIFDYSVLNSTKYEEYSSSIEEALYRALLRFDTLPEQTIKIIISVDKDGHNSTQVKADDQKIS